MPASIILGIFFVLGMYIFGYNILKARKSDQYVSVKGLAEKEVTADAGSWMITASNADNNLDFLKNNINRQMSTIKAWLLEKGLSEEEIKVEELSLRENIYVRRRPDIRPTFSSQFLPAKSRCWIGFQEKSTS